MVFLGRKSPEKIPKIRLSKELGKMWTGGPSSGPWPQPQWPMQQAMYQNIPHEQVDWAALAQQWIQMRETTPNDPPPPPLPPPPPDGRAMGPGLPPQRQMPHFDAPGNGSGQVPAHLPINRENAPMNSSLPALENREPLNHSDNSNSQDGSTFGQNSDWPGYWQSNSGNNASWSNSGSNWVPPLPPLPSDSKEGVQTFEYGHMHGNQGYAAQTYDYNHGSDQFNFNQNEAAPPEQPPFNQYWMQGGPPPFLRRDRKDDRFARDQSPLGEEDETSTSTLDAAKRKTLPAWIREGLEKMDREKMKKLEHETMLRDREERLKLQREREEQAMREQMAGAPAIPRKSKFDSDSENDSDGSAAARRSPLFPKGNRISPIRQRTPSPIEAPKTEQERLEHMMQKVRQMLTEILLEVTSEEIAHIAREIFAQAQAKAPALQLAKSSALASIVGGLGGLGGYGSDSAESESDNEDSEKPPARTSDIVDYVPSDLSEDEGGESRDRRESAAQDVPLANSYRSQGIPSPNVEARGDKYHFEKKYGEIPGLDVPVDADEGETANSAAESDGGGGGGGDKKGTKSDKTDESSDSGSSSSTSSSPGRSSSSTDSSDSSPKRRKKQEKGKDEDGERGNPVKSGNGRRDRSRSYDRNRRTSNSSRSRRSRSRDKRSRSRDRVARRRSRSRSRDRRRSKDRRRRSSRDRSRERERERGRDRDVRRSGERRRNNKRSNSRSSSSKSRSAERSKSGGGQRGGTYRGGYGSQRRRRSWSRGRPRRRSASPSRSRSRSPKRSSWRQQRSRLSRSSSRGSSDQQKMGKKSSRKPRT